LVASEDERQHAFSAGLGEVFAAGSDSFPEDLLAAFGCPAASTSARLSAQDHRAVGGLGDHDNGGKVRMPPGWPGGSVELMNEQTRRAQAIKRLKVKRDFGWHFATYVIINAFLVFIWWTGGGGGFWPVWVIVPWGIGLAFHAWYAFGGKPITEADIRREMSKHSDGTS
jgi:hypothetical protein